MALSLAASVAIAAGAAAADRAVGRVGLDPFAPARPVGVASDLPRSPLADVTVFGTERFATVAAARARCPGDAVVWVDALSNTYAPTAQPGAGAFLCKSSALSEGDARR